MKHLILLLKIFHIVCVSIFIGTLFALITRGIEWLPFSAVVLFMSISLKMDYRGLEEEIETNLNVAVDKIYKHCYGANPDVYDIEYLQDGKMFYISFKYEIEGYESRGAEYMGGYERLYTVTNEQITVLSFECHSDDTGEETDCGFTTQDIQDRL